MISVKNKANLIAFPLEQIVLSINIVAVHALSVCVKPEPSKNDNWT